MKNIILNLLTYTGLSMAIGTLAFAQQPQQDKKQNREPKSKIEKDSLLRHYDNNKWNDSLISIPIDTPPSLTPDSIPGKPYTPGNR